MQLYFVRDRGDIFICLVLPSDGPKHYDIHFTVIYDREKHQIHTFEKLVPATIWHFLSWQMAEAINQLSKQLQINFLTFD